jgi:hypothetical protein
MNKPLCINHATEHDACIQDEAPRTGHTASGYGRRMATRYLVRLKGKWRRVYCCQISNAGTCYVEGARDATGKRAWIIVDDVRGASNGR